MCPLARDFNLCLGLVQPRKTCSDMTENLLAWMLRIKQTKTKMGRKESNKNKKNTKKYKGNNSKHDLGLMMYLLSRIDFDGTVDNFCYSLNETQSRLTSDPILNRNLTCLHNSLHVYIISVSV